MWATYNEWKLNGLVVKKGVKSIMRDPYGVPLFHHSQTTEDKNEFPDDFILYNDLDYNEYK